MGLLEEAAKRVSRCLSGMGSRSQLGIPVERPDRTVSELGASHNIGANKLVSLLILWRSLARAIPESYSHRSERDQTL